MRQRISLELFSFRFHLVKRVFGLPLLIWASRFSRSRILWLSPHRFPFFPPFGGSQHFCNYCIFLLVGTCDICSTARSVFAYKGPVRRYICSGSVISWTCWNLWEKNLEYIRFPPLYRKKNQIATSSKATLRIWYLGISIVIHLFSTLMWLTSIISIILSDRRLLSCEERLVRFDQSLMLWYSVQT